jgi:histidyl-tRNA synthetase
MKAQMKAADRSGARFAAIVGEDEVAKGVVTLRDLRAERPQEEVAITDLAATLQSLMETEA